jgi:hypothetical protein
MNASPIADPYAWVCCEKNSHGGFGPNVIVTGVTPPPYYEASFPLYRTPKRGSTKFRKALEEIVDPIQAMRQLAADEGTGLDGLMAVTLAKDPEYLKSIARAALSATATEGK